MKILYGVAGEGMGHATRSKVIIEHLRANHEIHIISSKKAFRFLSDAFPGQVTEITGLEFGIKDGRISKMKTFTETIKTGPKDLLSNYKIYRALEKSFPAELVISDFETIAAIYAYHHKIPLISIDNIHVINRCILDIPIPPDQKDIYRMANSIVKARTAGAKKYFICSFFQPEIRKKNTVLVPPVLRDQILKTKTSIKNHILVYPMSQPESVVIGALNSISREKFIVYGYNKDEVRGNVILKSFSDLGFISDLSSCKAVITHGGFSLMTEALFLRKPVCSIPLISQFEQYMNSAYLDKMGFGKYLSSFDPDGIKAFIYDLPSYVANLSNLTRTDNSQLFTLLDEEISLYK